MSAEKFAGYFMLATAVIVAVPVVLQLRSKETGWKDALAPALFILGLVVVGAGYAFAAPENQKSIAVAGLAAMLLGFIFAQMIRNSQRRG